MSPESQFRFLFLSRLRCYFSISFFTGEIIVYSDQDDNEIKEASDALLKYH